MPCHIWRRISRSATASSIPGTHKTWNGRTSSNGYSEAKIAVALQDEFGRVPTKEEIDHVFYLLRVMYKAILGLHYKRNDAQYQPTVTRPRDPRELGCGRAWRDASRGV
jgi:hypothetical protein